MDGLIKGEIMDLGIQNRWAIVCAGSKGLGKACAKALVSEGVNVVINGRTEASLIEVQKELSALPNAGKVIIVAADITTAEGRAEVLAAAPKVDILINNAGGPPPGNYLEWGIEDWMKALNNNMLTAIELIKAVAPQMQAQGFGRIVNITSSAVKAPIDVLGLSNGARSGLTGFIAGIARTMVHENVTINNILPGSFATDRLMQTIGAEAEKNSISFEDAVALRKNKIPAKRLGEPDEFGSLCAYLCSAQAAYITGQNFLIDGGAYPGTF